MPTPLRPPAVQPASLSGPVGGPEPSLPRPIGRWAERWGGPSFLRHLGFLQGKNQLAVGLTLKETTG